MYRERRYSFVKFIRYLYEFCCSFLQPFHLTFGQAAASLLRPIRTTRKYGPYLRVHFLQPYVRAVYTGSAYRP